MPFRDPRLFHSLHSCFIFISSSEMMQISYALWISLWSLRNEFLFADRLGYTTSNEIDLCKSFSFKGRVPWQLVPKLPHNKKDPLRDKESVMGWGLWRSRTALRGFADRCLTPRPRDQFLCLFLLFSGPLLNRTALRGFSRLLGTNPSAKRPFKRMAKVRIILNFQIHMKCNRKEFK